MPPQFPEHATARYFDFICYITPSYVVTCTWYVTNASPCSLREGVINDMSFFFFFKKLSGVDG